MIGELRTWIINISTAVIFITAVEMILPNNSMKKYAKFVLGLILITILINPIIKLFNKDYNLDDYTASAYKYFEQGKFKNNMEEYKDEGMNKTVETFKINLEKICEAKLTEEFPNNNYKVEATVAYNEENDSVFVKAIKVALKDGIGNIESIKKIEIGSKGTTVNSNRSLNDEKSGLIKNYLSKELKIPQESIEVYKEE